MISIKPLRVIHLGKYYPPANGGIETHTQTLCQSLAARGMAVEVVVVNHQNAAGQDVTFERGARTETVVGQDGAVKVWRVGRRANIAKLDVTPGLPRLLRQLRKDPPDLWHLHTPNITGMLALLAVRGLRPLVITHHSDIIRQRILKHAVRPLENLIYGRAAAVLTDSPPYAGGSSLLAKMPEKVSALPLGIDLNPYQRPKPEALKWAERFRQEHGEPLWLSVGRLIYYKGLEIGLAALRKTPGKLLILGTGPHEAQWRNVAAEVGVTDRVVWFGRATEEQKIGAYHAATAYWFPSNARAEGFGLVQVEAMASGCPVINTAIPHSGVAWVSQHEISGLTVPVDDIDAFAAAANRIVTERGLRCRLAAGAQARAAAEFDQATMAERCEAVYRRVLENA